MLTRDILERLPAREPADPISDFHIPGDRANPGVYEVPNELAHRIGLDRGVRIDGDNNAARSLRQCVRKRRGLAAVRLANHAHGWVAPELFFEQLARAIG